MRRSRPGACTSPARLRPVSAIAGALALYGLLAVGAPATAQETPPAPAPEPPPELAETRFSGWERVETEHFLFVYEPRDRQYVDQLLSFAEDVYAEVTAFFESRPARIRVVVYGRTDAANGFFTPLPLHLALFVTAPSETWLGTRTDSWLRLLLVHELTHYVHLTKERPLGRLFSTVFGRELSAIPALFLPGWGIEGIAVYTETLFTPGGRGRNPYFAMQWKAPLLEDELFSFQQAAYNSAYPPAGRVYVAGHIIFDYLYERFGEGVYTRIMHEYVRFPYFGPWGAIRRVTGERFRDIYADMEQTLRVRSAADRNVVGGTLISPARRGHHYQTPQVADGRLYAYRRGITQPPAVVELAGDGSERVLVNARLTDASSYAVAGSVAAGAGAAGDGAAGVEETGDGEADDAGAGDGVVLWYTAIDSDRTHPTGLAQGRSDLYRRDPDGNRQRITRGAHLWHPAVSPDGTVLVAVQGAGPYTRLVAVDPATGQARTLFSMAEANVYTPSVSPDGRHVAFALNVRGMQDLYVIRADAPLADPVAPDAPVVDHNLQHATAVLPPDAAGELAPSFAGPRQLLFVSDRDGAPALYTSDLDGAGLRRVTPDPVSVLSAAADGDRLVYGSYASTGHVLKQVLSTASGLRPDASPGATPAAGGVNGTAASLTGSYAPPVRGSAAAASTADALPGRRYVDVPWPILWLPYPSILFFPSTSTDDDLFDLIDIGVGVYSVGASLLQRSVWSAALAYHPVAQQPRADLQIDASFGRFGIGYSLLLDYDADDNPQRYTQFLRHTLSLNARVIDLILPAPQRILFAGLHAGLRQTLISEDTAPFGYTDGLLAGDDDGWLSVVSGGDFLIAALGAPLDFYYPWAASLEIDNVHPLPGLHSQSGTGFYATLYANAPTVFHQVLQASFEGEYTTGNQGNAGRRVRGDFFTPRTTAGQGTMALDYLIPIAVLDQPLLFGTYLSGLAAGVHAEAVVGWDFETGVVAAPDAWYVGLDLSLLLGTSYPVIPAVPLGAGLAVRLRPGQTMVLAQDVRFYAFLGIESRGSAGGAAARRQRAPRRPSMSARFGY